MRLATRHPFLAVIALGLAVSLPVDRAAAEEAAAARPEYPLAASKLSIVESAKAARRRLAFEGRWTGGLAAMDPVFEGSSLRINGAPGADTGIMRLKQSRWKRLA